MSRKFGVPQLPNQWQNFHSHVYQELAWLEEIRSITFSLAASDGLCLAGIDDVLPRSQLGEKVENDPDAPIGRSKSRRNIFLGFRYGFGRRQSFNFLDKYIADVLNNFQAITSLERKQNDREIL